MRSMLPQTCFFFLRNTFSNHFNSAVYFPKTHFKKNNSMRRVPFFFEHASEPSGPFPEGAAAAAMASGGPGPTRGAQGPGGVPGGRAPSRPFAEHKFPCRVLKQGTGLGTSFPSLVLRGTFPLWHLWEGMWKISFFLEPFVRCHESGRQGAPSLVLKGTLSLLDTFVFQGA